MPTYTYKCSTCHDVVEVFHGMSDVLALQCTKCLDPMDKIITGGWVHVPLEHQSAPNRFKHHGIKDPIKGE